MFARNKLMLTGLIAFTCATLPACIERTEKIRVHRDGRVDIELLYKGDPSDFTSGDALPRPGGVWSVRDTFEDDKDDKRKQTRRARLHLKAGEPLPESFADYGDPAFATSLHFPTELTIERRPDGIYYHFKRVYEARQRARYEVYKGRLGFEQLEKDIAGKDFSELEDDQRRRLFEALRMLEAYKHVEYVDSAAREFEADWPQHVGLLLRQRVLDHFRDTDVNEVVELMLQPQSDERDAAIDAIADAYIAEVKPLLGELLSRLHVPATQVELFFAAYDEENARQDVTEDLNDETWKIQIRMPGTIVAHNADEIEDEFAVWEFPAEMLMDRDHVLMITSRVARGAPDHDDRD